MKRFFLKKGPKSPALPAPEIQAQAAATAPTPGSGHAKIPSLTPKFTIPPVPHPCPHDHLALLVTKEGLLLRPHGIRQPTSHVRVAWGKNGAVEELEVPEGEVDWEDAVVVYGIVGIMELFSASYLLAITAKTDVGHLFDETHAVYGVKGVTAIALEEDRATIVLNTLSARNTVISRPSLLASDTVNTIMTISSTASTDTTNIADTPTDASTPDGAQHVSFAPVDQVKLMTPKATQQEFDLTESRPSSPTPSHVSSLASESSSPVAKTLASRLSFWSRLSKRTSLAPGEEPGTFPSSVSEQDQLDKIMQEGGQEPKEVMEEILEATAPEPATVEERHTEMEDKILKECIREFTKGGMYFAYNFDITRSLQHKQEQVAAARDNSHPKTTNPLEETTHTRSQSHVEGKVHVLVEPNPTLPLWRRVDRQYWWNEWLSKPFVDAGLHPYVLPIMQGHYQIASFAIPREPVANEEGDEAIVDYLVVSRRSRDRAGLRYQRRGIDDEAHVANFAETETIMRVDREGASNVFSYVQIRGSIPLFWTQSGYSLKPAPQLSTDRTHAQNLDVIKRHFEQTVPRYGPHTCINLAEQGGREGAVTQGYREYMTELNSKDAKYYEYDFHTETKGMKYENISKLIETMERTFEHQGYLWISNGNVMSTQNGVYRINCIDCLDRTNVVQSAFARYVLNRQLGAVALLNPAIVGPTQTDLVFNDMWANNGDAISRAYAGTSALKGDFTRTGKRDLTGMLNDGVNSLARMYTSTFSDWFCQAVIDFMLGSRTVSVFAEFLLKLQSTDPRDLIRLSRIRAEAIATSVSRVLEEGERLLSGWTLFAPEEFNVKMGEKFEEKVLLLTAKAIYIISYDYTLEKVKKYTRILLGDITGLSKGAYIVSPLEEASRDPLQNAGFVITWRNNSNSTTRVTSYSVRNSLDPIASPTASPVAAASVLPLSPPKSLSPVKTTTSALSPIRRQSTIMPRAVLSRILTNASLVTSTEFTFSAFKALPIDPARVRRGSGFADTSDDLSVAASCKEAVDLMVDAIRNACEDAGSAHDDKFVTEEDVVSLANAQRTTSVYAKMEYGVKRLLWLGG